MFYHKEILGLLLLLNAGSGMVSAQTQKPDPCAKDMTQMEMNICSGDEAEKADKRLNLVYRKAMEYLQQDLAQAGTDQSQKKWVQQSIDDLKAAEIAWIKYRDLQCEAAAQRYEGGSIRPLIKNNCMSMATEHRVEEIKAAYENGDRKLE